MLTLVTGGSGSGKSAFAEDRVLSFGDAQRIYIATMHPFDEESHKRIERHQKMRAGKGFETIERYTELDELLIPKDCVVLLECMSNLVANEMFREDGFHPEVAEKITEGVKNLLSQAKHVVIVTNEIFSDGILYEEESEQYKKELEYLAFEQSWDRSTRNWQRWQKRLWKSYTGFLYGIKEERKHEKLMEQF